MENRTDRGYTSPGALKKYPDTVDRSRVETALSQVQTDGVFDEVGSERTVDKMKFKKHMDGWHFIGFE